jgi:hypothetical protein
MCSKQRLATEIKPPLTSGNSVFDIIQTLYTQARPDSVNVSFAFVRIVQYASWPKQCNLIIEGQLIVTTYHNLCRMMRSRTQGVLKEYILKLQEAVRFSCIILHDDELQLNAKMVWNFQKKGCLF